ncbi:MAG: geranylgeranylglycerol-phosphate geranylgeranyltransferase [Candidatus Aenigmarchaeota archaeon]|nr:geranylgeranylglycerol-phosphate geranylgeranyltransferase [Candidatus Aenigmarchaeota archaeon]
MNPYCKLLRPTVCLLSAFGLLVGAIVAQALVPVLALGLIAAFIICGAGNAINDYFDYEIDKINQPKRPIPSGRVSRKAALIYFAVLSIAGAALAFFVSLPFFVIAVFNIFVLFIYSWKLKPVALIGNAAVAYLAASSFLAAGLIISNFNSLWGSAIFMLAVVSFLGTIAREIIKDVEDIKGDEKLGMRTLPIVVGEKIAKAVAYAILVIACASLIWPYQMLSTYYLIGAIPGILACLYAIAKHKNPRKSQKMVKVAMYFVMLGFLLGSLL